MPWPTSWTSRRAQDARLTQSVIAALQSRSALLVLDNCEHVIDGAAELTQAIARHCPDVKVLATSREALGVSGEQLIAVGPLDPAGAGAELFNERAEAVSATFDAAASRDRRRGDLPPTRWHSAGHRAGCGSHKNTHTSRSAGPTGPTP